MGDRIASFKEKVEKNPNQVFFRYSLAQAYFEEGAFEQASAEFRKCLEVRPDWMMASLFVGKAEMESGNSQLAREFLEKTVALAEEQAHEDPMMEAKQLLDSLGSG